MLVSIVRPSSRRPRRGSRRARLVVARSSHDLALCFHATSIACRKQFSACATLMAFCFSSNYGAIGSEPDDQTALWDHLARRFAEHRAEAEASGKGKVRRLRPVLKPPTK